MYICNIHVLHENEELDLAQNFGMFQYEFVICDLA